MSSKDYVKTPSYYVRKRLFGNKPAVFGLFVVVSAMLISLLGHLIMPDTTPNAAEGAVEIQKKLPGFRVKVIKLRKNVEYENADFFEKVFFGRESEYTIVPIKKYSIEGNELVFNVFGREEKDVKMPLVGAIYPLYFCKDSTDGIDTLGNVYTETSDSVTFLDMKKNKLTVSKADLAARFESQNVEERVYWLGTDRAGRDILSRLLLGTRISISVGFVAVLISVFLGVLAGALAGYFGGKTDAFISWVMSVVWSVPSIMLVIAITMALQSRGILATFLAVGLTMWVETARILRGQIMAIKEQTFIEAARAFGLNNYRVIMNHILPNTVGSIIVSATTNFAAAILMEAGLSFLGLGVQPPTPSWGGMVYDGFMAIGSRDSWHLVVIPGFCISLLVLAFNLLGNGLHDAYDPHSKND
jgi:peptide/nickel transport system permease protein